MAQHDDTEAGEGGDIDGEYKRPDAAAAFKIYRNEISPKQAHMATIKGDLSDPYKRIKDDCHFPRKVMDFLVSLNDMEDAKRDHFLLALNLGMTELKLFMPRDLVTMAGGEDGNNVIPFGEREEDDLTDLANQDDDEFHEADEDELARQDARPSARKNASTADDPQPGTGAAAIAAMNKKSKAAKATAEGAAIN